MAKGRAGEDEPRAKSDAALREERILKLWQERDIFKKTLQREAPLGEFVFYEGPPTANGRPGIHHLESRAFKDAIPRYRTMRGYRVRRKAGWDTHGLPVELEVEKELGIKSKKDIESYGIEKFNQKCKESVLRYIDEWKQFSERIAFWVDHESTYFTFDNSYIESVWHILKRAHSRKLLYKDYKVVPWCPRCGTALSSHEVAQGYAPAKDPSVFVKFKIKPGQKIGEKEAGDNTYLLAWTTTPWTLPGNVALAVKEDLAYEKIDGIIRAQEGGSLRGKDLVGLEYEPLYPFIKNNGKAFRVYAGDFVSTTDGTGIVHTAVMYGAEDFELGTKEGLPKEHLVGEDGKFLPQAGQFAGLFVKKADERVIEDLEKRGLLFKKETIEHTYPFCWRCKTPLIYYARDSWYLRMSSLKGELIRENKKINWEPAHIKEGRFGEWLRELKDWAISRARFWGTPLPIWECEKCKSIEVIGSVDELKKRAGKAPDDLHRPYVDEVQFACACRGTMRRVPEVLDVWFDSGAMPFAQDHYPFENRSWVEGRGYPADYICEAIDQTRGWFYTLHAVGGLMGRGRAFKNVICLGHVLDQKGKKMSKSVGNVVEPMPMVDAYGADALRYFMYTVNAPGDSKNFDERAVDEIVKKNFNRLENVLAFYKLYSPSEKSLSPASGRRGNASESDFSSGHLLDRWILARLAQLCEVVTDGLENYQLDAATRPLGEFIDDLSTWYLRRSRERFKQDGEDKQAALAALRQVLHTLARLMAPTTPFFAEHLYQAVRAGHEPESVHLAQWPLAATKPRSLLSFLFPKRETAAYDETLVENMRRTRALASAALMARERAGIKIRQPLGALRIKDALPVEFQSTLAEEMNVKKIIVDPTLEGQVLLDTTITPELREEGVVRDYIRAIQEWRKESGLSIADRPGLLVKTGEHAALLRTYREVLVAQTNLLSLEVKEVPGAVREFERL